MVSIGTIFTIGIVGAVAAGIYAVSRNTDKIGGALTRGTEEYISKPFANYLDSLFQSLPGLPGLPKVSAATEDTGVINTPQDVIVQAGGLVPAPANDPNTDVTKFNPPGVIDYGNPANPGGIPTTPIEKLYNLFTLGGKKYYQGDPVPLGQEAILYYAKQGIIAREVYL